MDTPHTETTALPQGDVGLLRTAVAQRLLAAPLTARLAYTGADGTPRLIPINYHWTGEELVMGAFDDSYKIKDLRAHPDVAVCIDTEDGAPNVLMLRGKVTLENVEGVVPEYAAAQRQRMGEAAEGYLELVSGLNMVRIALRPTWVGVVDFEERFPERTPKPVLRAFGAT